MLLTLFAGTGLFALAPISELILKVLFSVMLATNKSESKLEFAEVNLTPTAADDVSINSDLIPGVYIYETSHNFDNYLKELGVNYILRQFAGWVTPIVNISTVCPPGSDLTNAECAWTIYTKTVVKEHSVTFKLNEKKNDVTMDGRNVQFVLAQTRSNQWIEIQTDGSKSTKITRDFFNDRMQVSLEINSIAAKSIFLRQSST